MPRPNDVDDVVWDLMVANRFRNKYKNAKDRGIEFTLSFRAMKNLLSATKCYYTGLLLTNPEGPEEAKLKPSDLTIDRIDCKVGYVSGNVVACSNAANQLKSQFEQAGIAGLKAGENVFKKSIKRIKQAEGKKK